MDEHFGGELKTDGFQLADVVNLNDLSLVRRAFLDDGLGLFWVANGSHYISIIICLNLARRVPHSSLP